MVDIGGGRGELLLDIKAAFPQLQASDLVVQEFNQDILDIPGITLATWNYKQEDSPQPIKGALIYHLAHILHNLSDLGSRASAAEDFRSYGIPFLYFDPRVFEECELCQDAFSYDSFVHMAGKKRAMCTKEEARLGGARWLPWPV
ncbi:hypothetical protein BBP40_002600 [Aspergillus hancockii]|nr:hypothetical protein BBP40_002600 [Aspergillus hancockii]